MPTSTPADIFGRSDFDNVIPEPRAFPAGNGDAGKGHEQTVSGNDLQKLGLMHILWVDLIIVDDGTQPRAGKGNLRMGIFALKQVGVHTSGKSVSAEVVKAQKRSEAHAADTAADGPLLSVEPVWENSLVACSAGLVLSGL